MRKILVVLMLVVLFVSPCPSWAAGSMTTNGYFYRPSYGEKGPAAYARNDSALVSTDAFLATIAPLPGLINDWAIEDQIVTMVPAAAAPTYSDADTFTMTGDYTSRFPASAVVQIHVAAGMVYSTVASSSYAAPTTTVNLNNAVLTDPITRVYVVATRDGLWPNGPGYVVAKDYDANNDGARADLEAADTVAAGAGRELRITGTWVIDDDVTLAANVKVMSGADLQIATTKTLTINGTLEAGPYQIFSCTGTGKVVFGNGAIIEAYPEWWGAKADDATDSTAALNAASIAATHIKLQKGYYRTSAAWSISANRLIRGSGASTIIKPLTGHADFLITMVGAAGAPISRTTFEDFYLDGDNNTTCLGGIKLDFATLCNLNRLEIVEFNNDAAIGVLYSDCYHINNNDVKVRMGTAGASQGYACFKVTGTVGGNNVSEIGFYGCLAQCAKYYGIWFDYVSSGTDSCVVDMCSAGWNTYANIYVGRNVHGLRISNTHIEYPGTGLTAPDFGSNIWIDGAVSDGARNISITGNYFYNAQVATGIDLYLTNCNGILVDRNYSLGVNNRVLSNIIHDTVTRLTWGDNVINGTGVTFSGDNPRLTAFTDADTTPSVMLGSYHGVQNFEAANTALTSITNFDNIVEGQKFRIYASTGNTTIVNGGNIRLTNRQNYRMPSGTWIEFACSATQAIQVGRQPLTATFTWDPGSLADGVGETSGAVTVAGALLGDFVKVAAPYDLQEITCTAYVSAGNTVKVRLQNESGGVVDLASGTWKVQVDQAQW